MHDIMFSLFTEVNLTYELNTFILITRSELQRAVSFEGLLQSKQGCTEITTKQIQHARCCSAHKRKALCSE